MARFLGLMYTYLTKYISKNIGLDYSSAFFTHYYWSVLLVYKECGYSGHHCLLILVLIALNSRTSSFITICCSLYIDYRIVLLLLCYHLLFFIIICYFLILFLLFFFFFWDCVGLFFLKVIHRKQSHCLWGRDKIYLHSTCLSKFHFVGLHLICYYYTINIE